MKKILYLISTALLFAFLFADIAAAQDEAANDEAPATEESPAAEEAPAGEAEPVVEATEDDGMPIPGGETEEVPDYEPMDEPPPPPPPVEAPAASTNLKLGPSTLNISVGGDVRIRVTTSQNMTDLNSSLQEPSKIGYDSVDFMRHRTRVWVSGESDYGVGAKIRLTAEPRWGIWDKGKSSGGGLAPTDNTIIFDQSFIQLKKILGLPITITFGRQDLFCAPGYCSGVAFWGPAPFLGEGFLVVDGTPYDGSRTTFFDGVRLNLDLKGINTSVDLWATKINEGAYNVSSDNDFYGFYLMNRSIKEFGIDIYALYKNQNAAEIVQGGDAAPLAAMAAGSWLTVAPRQNTLATGAMFKGNVEEGIFTYALQGVYEYGFWDEDALIFQTYADDIVRAAYGGYAWVGVQLTMVPTKPKLMAGFVYTSGDKIDEDNLNTGDSYELFDDMYAQWPKWSELLIYTNLDLLSAKATGRKGRPLSFVDADGNPDTSNVVWQDTDEGVWGNMMIIPIEFGLYPVDSIELLGRYYMFWANETKFLYFTGLDEDTGLANWTVGERKGNKRGDSLQVVLNWKVTKALSLQGYFEQFFTGDYYQDKDGVKSYDDAFFMRFQANYRF